MTNIMNTTRIVVVGTLTDDPDIHVPTPNITVRCSLTGGSDPYDADPFVVRCNLSSSQANCVPAELSRGAQVIVVGHLGERVVQSDHGKQRTLTEVFAEDVGIQLQSFSRATRSKWVATGASCGGVPASALGS